MAKKFKQRLFDRRWNNNPANPYAVLPRRRPLTDAEAMDEFLEQVEDELSDYEYDYFNS
jgi:hypothetical protein